ncbi:MAG: phosphoribosyltransferase family protein [Aeromonas sp.]|uniref:phosphoribosyltransferase family protein n=1 Tax=Aeromonas sp. TaxID=647 RepID=UPI002FC9704F
MVLENKVNMYSYRSISDLSSIISEKINIIPSDIDLVVGVPRSGMLPASIIALYLNTPLTDIYSYVENRPLISGQTRRVKKNSLSQCDQAKHILVVDDSIASGKSMQMAMSLLSEFKSSAKFTYCCIYGVSAARSKIDIIFENVSMPRIFEWNIFHHQAVESACFDIDGVLCVDPTNEQNDDGDKYINFILNAEPLFIPTKKVKYLVTSRLEKYRLETEAWLKKYNVDYEKLFMLDLPDAETRRKLGAHSKFKSEVYKKNITTTLFIESELNQAIDIANLTGKDVFCTETMALVTPSENIVPQVNKVISNFKWFLVRCINYLRRRISL